MDAQPDQVTAAGQRALEGPVALAVRGPNARLVGDDRAAQRIGPAQRAAGEDAAGVLHPGIEAAGQGNDEVAVALFGEVDQVRELVRMRAGWFLHHDVTAAFETVTNGGRRVRGNQRDDGQVRRGFVQPVRQLLVGAPQLEAQCLSGLREGAAGFVHDGDRVHQIQVAQRLQKKGPVALFVGLHHQRDVHPIPCPAARATAQSRPRSSHRTDGGRC